MRPTRTPTRNHRPIDPTKEILRLQREIQSLKWRFWALGGFILVFVFTEFSGLKEKIKQSDDFRKAQINANYERERARSFDPILPQ